jgi:hypothetical protein
MAHFESVCQYLHALKKTIKYSRRIIRDSNQAPPEYKSKALSLKIICSLIWKAYLSFVFECLMKRYRYNWRNHQNVNVIISGCELWTHIIPTPFTAWEVSLCQCCMKSSAWGRQRGKSKGGNFPFPFASILFLYYKHAAGFLWLQQERKLRKLFSNRLARFATRGWLQGGGSWSW